MEKKKRKYSYHLSDSSRKRAKHEYDQKLQVSSRVYITGQTSRWHRVKVENNLRTDGEVADLLLSWYERTKSLSSSTPLGPRPFKVTSPSVSFIRPAATTTTETAASAGETTETAISGVENLSDTLRSTIPASAHSNLQPSESSDSDPYGLVRAAQHDHSYRPYMYSSDSDSDSESCFLDSMASSFDQTGIDEDVLGHRASDGSSSDDSDDDQTYLPTSGIHLVGAADEVTTQRCGLSYLSSLEILAAHAPRETTCQHVDCDKDVTCTSKQLGTAVYMTWACGGGHIMYRWCSQPRLKARGVPLGDFLLSVNVVLSGNNMTKISLLLKFLNMGCPSEQLHHSIEKLYTCPSIDMYWEGMRQRIHESFKEKDVVLAGDGRNDSPGHSAQYCTYTLMEHDTKSIVEIAVVDKRQVALKSPNMEAFGMRRALDAARGSGLKVKELVTDAHRQIGSIMKKDYPDVTHDWDIWHGCKNLNKKLQAVASEKACRDLVPWLRDIQNHFWFCAQNCAGSVELFLNMWKGILHHIVNRHEWPSGKCHHGHLEQNRDKPWLTSGSRTHEALRGVIMDKTFLSNIRYFVNFRHTGTLETYHSHILMYAAKRFAFSFPAYVARNKLAAIDYQSHKDRPDKKTRKGEARYKRIYNKKTGQWTAQPVKEPKSYDYIPEIQRDMVERCLQDKLPIRRKLPLDEADPRQIKRHLAPVSPGMTKELAQAKRSRFAQKKSDDSSDETIIYWQ